MPRPDFFGRLGLFVIEGFFDADLCQRVLHEVQSATQIPVSVLDGYTFEERVKEDTRRTRRGTVGATSERLVESRLAAVKPSLESHFGVTLEGCEKAQFLVYGEGDFFRPHRDRDDEPGKPRYIRDRKVSVTIFLNDERTGAPAYRGGALTFYGLITDPRWEKYGFPLTGEAGTMVAFRSDVLHEVAPVDEGHRYSVVTWFF